MLNDEVVIIVNAHSSSSHIHALANKFLLRVISDVSYVSNKQASIDLMLDQAPLLERGKCPCASLLVSLLAKEPVYVHMPLVSALALLDGATIVRVLPATAPELAATLSNITS